MTLKAMTKQNRSTGHLLAASKPLSPLQMHRSLGLMQKEGLPRNIFKRHPQQTHKDKKLVSASTLKKINAKVLTRPNISSTTSSKIPDIHSSELSAFWLPFRVRHDLQADRNFHNKHFRKRECATTKESFPTHKGDSGTVVATFATEIGDISDSIKYAHENLIKNGKLIPIEKEKMDECNDQTTEPSLKPTSQLKLRPASARGISEVTRPIETKVDGCEIKTSNTREDSSIIRKQRKRPSTAVPYTHKNKNLVPDLRRFRTKLTPPIACGFHVNNVRQFQDEIVNIVKGHSNDRHRSAHWFQFSKQSELSDSLQLRRSPLDFWLDSYARPLQYLDNVDVRFDVLYLFFIF